MKKLIYTVIGVFVFVILMGLSVVYIKTYACKDVNKYIAGVQTGWGVPEEQQFQFTPWSDEG